MKKIISLFERNYAGDGLVLRSVVPGAEWVVAGEGVATRKFDGTCCLVRDGQLYKRYDAKRGKTPPPGFEPAQEPDPQTGHWPGWVPVLDSNPGDAWHIEARDNVAGPLPDGTYELCGPKIQSNPDADYVAVVKGKHMLIPHGKLLLLDFPRDFDGIKEYFRTANIEGVVWHHMDGRMVKIKTRDFGLKRGALLPAPGAAT